MSFGDRDDFETGLKFQLDTIGHMFRW